jgi:hypothetical protein
MQDLTRQYQWIPNAISIAGSLPPFNDMRAKAVEKIGSEVDISLLTVSRHHSPVSASTTVNISSPMGLFKLDLVQWEISRSGLTTQCGSSSPTPWTPRSEP